MSLQRLLFSLRQECELYSQYLEKDLLPFIENNEADPPAKQGLTSPHVQSKLTKYTIAQHLITLLDDKNTNPSLKIIQFTQKLEKTKPILMTDRDHATTHYLEKIGFIFSAFIFGADLASPPASIRGSYTFFKPQSDMAMKKIEAYLEESMHTSQHTW